MNGCGSSKFAARPAFQVRRWSRRARHATVATRLVLVVAVNVAAAADPGEMAYIQLHGCASLRLSNTLWAMWMASDGRSLQG